MEALSFYSRLSPAIYVLIEYIIFMTSFHPNVQKLLFLCIVVVAKVYMYMESCYIFVESMILFSNPPK